MISTRRCISPTPSRCCATASSCNSARRIELLTRPADDFVRDFMGGSTLGLKLLALRHVGERVKPEPAAGEPIAPETSLAEALSQMVLRRTEPAAGAQRRRRRRSARSA